MLPGVSQVALTQYLPILGSELPWYSVLDHDYADDTEYPFGGYTRISEDFFSVIGVEMVAGRSFNSNDALGTEPVVIVDERFVERNWPGRARSGSRCGWVGRTPKGSG